MMHRLVLIICLVASFPVFAPPPTEAEMKEAARKYDAESLKKVREIFDAWIADGSERSLLLAQKYLLPPVGFESSVGSTTRNEFVDKVLEKKVVALYAAALTTARREFNERPVHTAVVDAIAAAMPKNPTLAAKVLQGAPDMNLAGFLNGTVLSVRSTYESRVLTDAFLKNGQLSNVTRVNYGGNSGSLEFAAPYLDIAKLPEAISAAGNDAAKLKTLMAVRETLSTGTTPTREEFTARMISLMESQPPEVRLKMAQAARDHMVKNVEDRGSSSGENRRTLTLNMYDSADINLARFLMMQPVTASSPKDPKGPKLTGLRDVELISYMGPRELKTENNPKTGARELKPGWETVRYHQHNQVFDVEGWRISDQLDPKNYASALHTSEHGASAKNAVWRTDEWLQATRSSQRSWPLGSASDVVGCGLEQVAPAAATQK